MSNKISKRQRKLQRSMRRRALIADYRNDCRAVISSLRRHNATAQGEDRITEVSFRVSLKRLRHDFTRAVARAVKP